MRGQWIGDYQGSTTGVVVVNVDEGQSSYQGVAYLIENDKNLPSSVAFFTTQNKERELAFRTNVIHAIDPISGNPVVWESVQSRYRNMTFSSYADVKGSWNENSLSLCWTTDTGVTGHSVIPRSRADKSSEVPSDEMDWESYKSYVAQLEGRRYLFRGQNDPWRLRTSFHRKGRADLTRFFREDILALHRHLSSRTKHIFNLQIPNENGAFLNLVQHHGYPTPLLDWTYSPYVAAFFAYRGLFNAGEPGIAKSGKVRILVFDHVEWKANWIQLPLAMAPGPHVSIFEFVAIENERMIPQQAASMVTSVDDIETYIGSRESDSKRYLRAIDLPKSDRKKVMSELAFMGITAGSLFPGLDGACEELAERNFER